MFDGELYSATGGHQIVRHHLQAAQAKWGRLTAADYTKIATIADLIKSVGDRYSIPAEEARQDVDLWLADIGVSSGSQVS